ncbi:hypothetical protein FOVSG1_009932 [Fusarium oxysporum f. sp. vasinfectum]
MDKLKVHGSIVRAINRNMSCAFIHFPFTWNPTSKAIPSIVYNCRTSACWEGDMALSVTFFPGSLTTNAVWYGCDLSKRKFHGDLITDSELIYGQLENFDGGVFYPMVLPVVFAGFERERHIGTNISFLRIGLQNLQTQLRKMIDHVDQLHDTDLDLPVAARVPNSQTRLHIIQDVGVRLKTRLQDLVDEYDEYIRQCTHIMDGLTLVTQLELNSIGRKDARINQEISRVKLEVAQMTQRRKLQNRLNQRAYRRRRHHRNLAAVQESVGCTQAINPKSTRSFSTQAGCVERHSVHVNKLAERPMFLLLKWPNLRRDALEFLQRATTNWSLNLPQPRDLPSLSRLNAFDALARNAMVLRIPHEYLETDEHHSLFNYHGPVVHSSKAPLPPSLCPTELQKAIVHHSWLDIFPFPNLRDNILRGIQLGQLEEDELCDRLCCDLLSFNEDSIPSLLIWGDSWDAAGWEFSSQFFEEWGFLLEGCPELIQATNYWREVRGELKIEFDSN